ncbi:hypothetical protein Kpol_1013p10 [Vanderwaltozyma polyspora DSM 70294]|uniref:Vacuolar membrane protein n=1 Tax=Vanderwaltozyma polyspora (strain ATCC 22028 / DSM 70294 / BCRC 21397 / CBS 2163 / NBRC 10782 / NRRL Y-8283 / UCD 57-17) TaxID=436907 RepID=A7TH58_VANPO|nr:uncharacterized protein Kpol_1013p10 [Vanderwaltozyma polyspora DSM 70294]EDO18339.1 hypothetical protein Kpol_1013p10 [Vanderwaltozyma polyspora DSM 70294]
MAINREKCQLLGPVSITIQIAMGAIAIISLLLKRNYEHPRRKMIVWIYDVGKQVIGSLVIHFLNLGISILKGKRENIPYRLLKAFLMSTGEEFQKLESDDDDEDQCDWYFLNLLLDTTIGIPILWASLTMIENVCIYFKVENIESGNYFASKETVDNENGIAKSPKPLKKAFIKQLIVFTSGLLLMKIIIFGILNYFEDVAYWFANLLLGWSDPWPNFQVFLVMFVSPILLNCFQYFCVDNIIKLPIDHINMQNSNNFEPDSYNGDDDFITKILNRVSGINGNPSKKLLPASSRDTQQYGSI